MSEFKKPRFNSSGPRRPFGGNGGGQRFSGNRGFDQKEMFSAECNSCHKQCQVPFRPNGKKPVYCPDCFKRDDDRGERPRFDTREYAPQRQQAPAPTSTKDPRIDDLKRQLDTMNATLERLVSALDSSNRAAALTKEVQKHVPAAKPASAPAKAPVKKPTAKPAPEKAAKKPAKKAAKSPKK
ncbi:MAG TPA: CxxC-x17-CxxC domain-containing protein [Candidatus Paceibacterota bacterium]|jgi:CxxC-x17-CxxC domain-containing protein